MNSQDNLHGIGRDCIAEFRLNYETTEIHVASKFIHFLAGGAISSDILEVEQSMLRSMRSAIHEMII